MRVGRRQRKGARQPEADMRYGKQPIVFTYTIRRKEIMVAGSVVLWSKSPMLLCYDTVCEYFGMTTETSWTRHGPWSVGWVEIPHECVATHDNPEMRRLPFYFSFCFRTDATPQHRRKPFLNWTAYVHPIRTFLSKLTPFTFAKKKSAGRIRLVKRSNRKR